MTKLMSSGKTSPDYNGSRYRSAEDIISAILAIADTEQGATKMKIMANAFVTYETATGCLEKLKREGFVDYNQGTGTYVTTSKGREMIAEMKENNPDFSQQHIS